MQTCDMGNTTMLCSVGLQGKQCSRGEGSFSYNKILENECIYRKVWGHWEVVQRGREMGSTGKVERNTGKGIRSVGKNNRVVEDQYAEEYKGEL